MKSIAEMHAISATTVHDEQTTKLCLAHKSPCSRRFQKKLE